MILFPQGTVLYNSQLTGHSIKQGLIAPSERQEWGETSTANSPQSKGQAKPLALQEQGGLWGCREIVPHVIWCHMAL